MVHSFGTVDESGKLVIRDLSGFRASLRSLRNKTVEIQVKKYVRVKTTPQLAYYWGVVIPMMCKHLGYSRAEDMHDALKMHFLVDRTVSETLPTVRGVSTLNVEEMSNYLDSVIQLGAEIGCVIPEAVCA